MKYMKKIRIMEKKKLVNRVLLFVMIIYSLVFTGLFLSLSGSLNRVINDISIPDDYFLVSLEPSSPLLRVSYRVANEGFDITSIIIDFKVDLLYNENYNNTERRDIIFLKREIVTKINPWQNYRAFIEGGDGFFNIVNLNHFWANANLSRSVFFIFDINITGKYWLGFIPFTIQIKNFNPKCQSCN
ncbi:MAG: hypothetical protein ACFFE4_01575 [Candidatus Thorarchaeota archaeon]